MDFDFQTSSPLMNTWLTKKEREERQKARDRDRDQKRRGRRDRRSDFIARGDMAFFEPDDAE